MHNNNIIPNDQLISLLNHDYQFIDLRDSYEYKSLHIEKFVNIPIENFDLNTYHFSKSEPIILLCYSGQRSKELAKKLNDLGYKAYSIEGGFYSLKQKMNSH